MAIERTGTALYYSGDVINAGTFATDITVPADAEIVVATFHGFRGAANHFSGGAMTFTKGGVDTAMTVVPNTAGADTSTATYQGCMFYLVLPDTGTNKTWKWDWAGAASLDDATRIGTLTFLKGVNTTTPVRDGGGQNGTTFPKTTGTITAVTGDLILAVAFGPCGGGEGSVTAWSNLTTLEQRTAGDGNMDIAFGTGSPSGNTTVEATTATNWSEGGIVAASLIPAGAGAGVVLGERVMDFGLSVLDTECDRIYVCSAMPTTYTEATSTFALGNKNWGAGNAFGSPSNKIGGGREITSNAITDGTITAAGTVSHWAAVDSSNSRLLASGTLTGDIAVTSGQFTLSALVVGLTGTA